MTLAFSSYQYRYVWRKRKHVKSFIFRTMYVVHILYFIFSHFFLTHCKPKVKTNIIFIRVHLVKLNVTFSIFLTSSSPPPAVPGFIFQSETEKTTFSNTDWIPTNGLRKLIRLIFPCTSIHSRGLSKLIVDF